jgi:choline dehydrogenase-like flavoprotein
VFELLEKTPATKALSSLTDPSPTFEDLFFTYTPGEAAKLKFDTIIVGTGIGGGIIAGDLFDTNSKLGSGAKSVLVIEKGGLSFHSHCLNASRPSGFGRGRAQQNDTFFSLFKKEYKGTVDNKDWKGGPMYNLGGRSAVWGLFAPRVHDDVLRTKFAPGIADELITTWYGKAESLMNVSLPATTTTHQILMERLNMKTERGCQWQWGRIASEFHDPKNFDFAEGAYSTIDKLLEIAMSKPRDGGDKPIEHPNWKILLNTDVREITWNSDKKRAIGVKVKASDGKVHEIKLKDQIDAENPLPAIILAAGSVASPTILLRSGLTEYLTTNGGLHLTDHDIFYKMYTFQYRDPSDRARVGAMKLQTYARPKGSACPVLINLAVDATAFLPRGPISKNPVNEPFPVLTAAFIRGTALNKANTITLKDDEPVVTVNRSKPFRQNDEDILDLKTLTVNAKDVIKDVLSIEVLDEVPSPEESFFGVLELGGVAHELGTIPMPGKVGSGCCVDKDLKLESYNSLFICDLSVFPCSPEVNTTLTLAALALRLSRKLLPSEPNINDIVIPNSTSHENTVFVMNQTGEKIKVIISNHVGASETDTATILKPGEILIRLRKKGIMEAVFVYRLKYHSADEFMDVPVLFKARPGSLLTI